MPTSTIPVPASGTQLLDQLWACQNARGYIRDEDVEACAAALGISEIEIEGVISFYHFFHRQPAGRFTIYLNNSIVSEFKGFERVKAAFESATGAVWNGTDPGGLFGLYPTACIGLSDQEPAALINFQPFTNLNSLKVKGIVAQLKNGVPAESLADEIPDHIRYVPDGDKAIFFRPYHPGSAVVKLPAYSPGQVIDLIRQVRLTGRGGAFFPTGLKWESCARQTNPVKYIVCNADEGEPGTFKDRVLMKTAPGLMIEGMIAAGYAVGAQQGIIYLRAEYTWLKPKLDKTIQQFRNLGYLGEDIAGIKGFQFDVRIQLGAGAYVCGEETALLNSLEGKRGEPRTKWFYPTEKGFLDCPTVVNNVETFCAAARALELGAEKILQTGAPDAPGTKVLSVSGDCRLPGIYEVEWGMPLGKLLDLCQADDPHFVQISGPSGICVPAAQRDRLIAPSDLSCGGAVMVFNADRDILRILTNFNDFFKHESCGVCTPCRAGNFILQRKLEKIEKGLAYEDDFKELIAWGNIMKKTSRCGLGRTAPNTLIAALEQFPAYFAAKAGNKGDGLNKNFDLEQAETAYDQFAP